MAGFDPRLFQMHGGMHPSMLANMNSRYGPHGGNPPTAPGHQPPVPNPRAAGGQVQGGEDIKKKSNAGWENTYKTAQRIPFPDPRAACGDRVGDFVEDLARAIGCPVEYVLVLLLPCVGGLLGTQTSIHVHRGWSEPAVLWSMVGALPGSRRSAVIRQLLNPILSLQRQKASDTTEALPQERALYSGTRITLPAITEVLHRNDGHAFSLTENIENLHDMLGLLQPVPAPRLISVMEDLYEGLPLVAVESGRVTTILGSNFCHGGFASPEYIVTVLMKYPSWLSSRLLMSCPMADDIKGVFGESETDTDLPSLDEIYSKLLNMHAAQISKYVFDKEAVQELSRFFDEEWSSVLSQLEQNEHEGLIGKSMGQIVRISGILKSLDNAIQSITLEDDQFSWDWIVDVDTVKSAIVLGKYFLEQKLAITFMVGTGFFNNCNPMEDGASSMNGSHDRDYPDSPTTLPQTAFHEGGQNHSANGSKGGGGGHNDGGNDGNTSDRSRDDGGFSGNTTPTGGAGSNLYATPSHSMPYMQQHANVSSSNKQQESNQQQPSSFGNMTPSQQTQSLFELPKRDGETNVDFTHLPQVMTTMEEDVSEMMQGIDFVHFSKTQFVAVHGRRIKRLMECYDDGHGVSATTAAQKSITPPVRVLGTNNRHPAWASALFFQKVAELELGIAEQGRHPTNRKVCWRFKRKPVNQLAEKDFQLLQYLRIDMDKYSHFGSVNFNPTMMVNSGLISLGPANKGSPSSSPIPTTIDDEGTGSNSQSSQGSGIPLNANQSGPRNSMPISIKPELF